MFRDENWTYIFSRYSRKAEFSFFVSLFLSKVPASSTSRTCCSLISMDLESFVFSPRSFPPEQEKPRRAYRMHFNEIPLVGFRGHEAKNGNECSGRRLHGPLCSVGSTSRSKLARDVNASKGCSANDRAAPGASRSYACRCNHLEGKLSSVRGCSTAAQMVLPVSHGGWDFYPLSKEKSERERNGKSSWSIARLFRRSLRKYDCRGCTM